MTNEDRQRTMDFILQQQAKFAASVERLEEERIRDRPRLARFEESFQTVVELLKIQESRLDRVEFRTDILETKNTALETNMAALAAAQAHADQRLSALIDIVMQDRGRASCGIRNSHRLRRPLISGRRHSQPKTTTSTQTVYAWGRGRT